MDELSLIVEGLENKVKKLLIRNKQLKDKIFQLEEERLTLSGKAEAQATRIQQLEGMLAELEAARALGSGDTMHARQKVNELLREIDKCQLLLNS
jgi:chromosome segregation ATPase